MKMFAVSAVLALVAGSASAATTLANWTFEGTVPTTAGPHTAEAGLFAASSQALGSHVSTSTVYSNPVGNGTAESFSSDRWAIGDYYQFKTSTLGYNTISIAWDQTSSNTGPRDFNLSFSTDGVNFTNIGSTYVVLANSSPNTPWSSATYNPAYSYSVAAPVGAANAANVYFRLTMASNVSANGGTVATGGTSRVDSVVINGEVVPAPSSLALLGLGGLAAARRRR